MDTVFPIYTVRTECQDCYKCIRRCPVKAIKVREGRAEVMPRRCISCGQCVFSCPSKAKHVRNDIGRVRDLIQSGKKVLVSLAPSWRGSFDYRPRKMIAVLKALGFDGVGETAVGAQEVSIKAAQLLNGAPNGLYISSACPVIVDYVRQYEPDFACRIMPVGSPALTHARFFKNRYGDDCEVVFIGPCIGKKNESDAHPELLAAALTFDELRCWLREDGINTDSINPSGELDFMPEAAHEGSLYPLDGGMNETIRRVGVRDHVQLVNVSSLEIFARSLRDMNAAHLDKVLFIEAMACAGGCIVGPCISSGSGKSSFEIISDVLSNTRYRREVPREPALVVPVSYEPKWVDARVHTLEELRGALKRIGKFTAQDELNCAGCGYQSCMDLARAMLDGYAEPAMCVSYMRQVASRKADAMLRHIPSAVAMLDGRLDIIEVNDAFISMFAGENKKRMTHPARYVGLPAEAFLSFTPMLRKVLKTGEDMLKEHFQVNNKLYDLYIFCVEPGECIGVIITDVTSFFVGSEKTARRAREVISRNISIVQEIACLLGEHMVETETLLSSIASGYEENGEDECS
ncbi:MAG: 4Fe-4S binding protein [Deltaproteobacteria bacterium]|jgi:iron only hydrogenase large subunit-like protein|nr:4Fe-4S binding protein [Deltaproteobacteria bacterium]